MHRGVIRSLLLFTVIFQSASSTQTSSPPSQPNDGPGGSKYAHAAVTKNRYGTGAQEYWLYEPDEPRPCSAPLVVFLHGWGGTNPAVYGAWLEHLVRRGNIVVYPRYQADLRTPLGDFTPNTLNGIKQAIERLQTETGHVRPELDKFAVVGHSVGGLLTANVAALANESGLPKVRAMMSVEPGRTWNRLDRMNVPLADLGKIPPETLLLTVCGDQDNLARCTDARRIYYESRHVAATNKNFVMLVSDAHGRPALNATHFAPAAPDKSYDSGESNDRGRQFSDGRDSALRERIRERLQNRRDQGGSARVGGASIQNADALASATNALDFYGTWKLFDALCDAAFYARNRVYALGNTQQQRFMGLWSDKVPVKQLIVKETP
jgi:pimeloyl-ACP methyl ester carboxylesterase